MYVTRVTYLPQNCSNSPHKLVNDPDLHDQWGHFSRATSMKFFRLFLLQCCLLQICQCHPERGRSSSGYPCKCMSRFIVIILGGAANGEFGDCNVKTSQDFYILGIYFENINTDLGFQCGLGISRSVHSFHASFNLWINAPGIIDAKASFHHHFEVFLFSQAHKAG